MQKVAVVQSLQAEVIEPQITPRIKRCAQACQVELLQTFVQQFGLHALLDVLAKVFAITLRHLRLAHFRPQNFAPDGMQQQACCGSCVGRVFFNQGARCKDRRFVHFFHRHTVIQVASRLSQDGRCADV